MKRRPRWKRRLRRVEEPRARRRGALGRAGGERRRRAARAGAARRAPRPGDRSDLGPRSVERIYPRRAISRRGRRAAGAATRRICRALHRSHGRARRGDARASRRGRHVFDYGNNLRAHGRGGRRRRTPLTSRASCPPTSARCSARAKGRSAGSRSRAIPTTSASPTMPCCERSRRRSRCAAGWLARERVKFQGLPARICWLGYGERDKAGLALQ